MLPKHLLNNTRMKKIIIAYGNPDRQDDGAGWYVLNQVSTGMGRIFTDYTDDFYAALGQDQDFLFVLQLTPELVDVLSGYDAVAFIDAKIAVPGDLLQVEAVQPMASTSPLSHHMSPQALLAYLQDTHNRQLEAWLITVPGFAFGFSRQLTEPTVAQADLAVNWLIGWLNP